MHRRRTPVLCLSSLKKIPKDAFTRRSWRKLPVVPLELKRKISLYSFTYRINRKMKYPNGWIYNKAQAEDCAR